MRGEGEKGRKGEISPAIESDKVLLNLCLPADRRCVHVFLSFLTENCIFGHANSFHLCVAIFLSYSAELVAFIAGIMADQKVYRNAYL